jgi:exo-beta-1,3-glucanase (GH17 family)
MRKKVAILAICIVIVLLLVYSFKIWNHHFSQLPACAKTTVGVDFDPMRKNDTQTNGEYPSAADIESDLALLENKVRSIRTYSVSRGLDQLPGLAEKHHLTVTLGAWIGVDLEKNREEMRLLQKTLQSNSQSVIRILVGNEALMRKDVSEQQLIDYIREVKQFERRPVSTSERWEDWMLHPAVAAEVDYIGVHLTPYWSDVSVDEGVNLVFDWYAKLQKAYPNKPIVITEVGWPSEGPAVGKGVASAANQARFLCKFMLRAEKEHIIYYVLEAFDQPWKVTIEGPVGAHWGVFDADRKVKYPIHL